MDRSAAAPTPPRGHTEAWPLVEPPQELAERYRREGYWDGSTLVTVLSSALSRSSGLPACFHSDVRPRRCTYSDLEAEARRLAAGLRRRGIRSGDVVAFQLPNWAEAATTFWGALFVGAVLLPIPHFYGPREVSFMLHQTGARALVVADRFRGRDHLAEIQQLRSDASELEHVIVVGDAPFPWATRYDELIDATPLAEVAAVDPARPAAAAFTSGTSADPKGVLLTHRALAFELTRHMAVALTPRLPLLSASPVTHITGMLVSLLLPPFAGMPLHVADVWDPDAVLDAMLAEDVTAGSGAAIFLTSLLDHPALRPEHLARMSEAWLGGSPVPRALGERADALGVRTTRVYGCTEQPTITASRADDRRDRRICTDGAPLVGVEVRIVDDGDDVSPGAPGEVWSRGPDLFSGYLDAAHTADALRPGGWYATGDIGILDHEGYLTITDRVKDIIIRGGENISAAEVEELLLGIEGVAEVAVVAAPDTRLGEHACAFLRLRPDAPPPGLAEVRAHLAEAGLTRQKWPEQLHIVDDLPRTPSGKIKKSTLRDSLRRSASADG